MGTQAGGAAMAQTTETRRAEKQPSNTEKKKGYSRGTNMNSERETNVGFPFENMEYIQSSRKREMMENNVRKRKSLSQERITRVKKLRGYQPWMHR